MTRLARFLPALLLAVLNLPAQDQDFEKLAVEAMGAGDLAEARRLCEHWVAERENDVRARINLGRVHVKAEQFDEALAQFEIARDLAPKDPEPLCEAGMLFLQADMAGEAIVEFKAALELRADYPPAVNGLARAEASLGPPYRSGVWIGLGELNDERGLRQLEPQKGRVASIGGRQCRATDKAAPAYYLYFDVADDYLFDVDAPVRVAIEYYDTGTGRFRFMYDSSDTAAGDHGIRKWSPWIQKRNSETWRTVTSDLPDAKFANRGWWGADLVICSQGWDYKEDIYISSLQVVQGGLKVSVEPEVGVADGTSSCGVTASVVDAGGPVADGTPVRFATDKGTIDPEADTIGGKATAAFTPGTEPGEATITVEAGEERRTVHVPILPGSGGVTRRRLVLDSFEQGRGWRFEGGGQEHATLQAAPETQRDGRPSTRIAYRLRPGVSSSHVTFRRPLTVPGRPVSMGLWVNMDGSRSRFQVVWVDATGQTLVFPLGVFEEQGWQWIEHDLGAPAYVRGGAGDGRMHLPARCDGFQIGRYYGPPGKAAGDICVQDLTVVTDVPESAMETVVVDVAAAAADFVFHLPVDPTFQIGMTNLGRNRARGGGLRWQVTNDMDEVVAQGSTDELEIAPETRRSEDVTIQVPTPGLYCATFALESGDKGQQRPDPPVVRFLALWDMPRSNPAGQMRRHGREMAIRMDNRTDEPSRFGFSYQLLNAEREVVHRASQEEAEMEMGPGEEIEVPVPIDGLAAGRYSALLFFTMPEAKRHTRLLPFEVYPDVVSLSVKVVTKDGEPVPGASVRGRLDRRDDSGLWERAVALDEREARTGEDGLCELAGRVPDDIEFCRLELDVAASGFVDLQSSFDPRRLYDPERPTQLAVTVALAEGSRVTGRIVGADGKPVKDANVQAWCVTGEPPTRSHGCRPRTTDPDGRFELFVPADSETRVTVKTSRWAPRNVTVTAGQSDAGNIPLESGTRVSGTLLDEHGQPARAYWVLAWNAEHGIQAAAKTDDDGGFVFPPLNGSYQVWTPRSFVPWCTEPPEHSPEPRVVVLPQVHTFDDVGGPVELELRGRPEVKVSGHVFDIDGTPAAGVRLSVWCAVGASPGHIGLDATRTDAEGRFQLDGIPSGAEGVTVSVPVRRRWKNAEEIYLKAKPLATVQGARDDGTVWFDRVEADVPGTDFQFSFWNSERGFLRTAPRPERIETQAEQ